MPTLSRRHLLTSTGALPALAVVAAVPALATPTAPAELDPVIELAERAIKTWDDLNAAISATDTFGESMFDWRLKNPPPEKGESPTQIDKSEDAAGRTIMRIRCGSSSEIKQRKALDDRAYRNWQRREARFAKQCGYADAEKKQQEVETVQDEALDRLNDAHPRTWAGLVAKARAARHCGQRDSLCQQIAFDIGIMAGDPDAKDDDEVVQS
jgi:hypothetical protein